MKKLLSLLIALILCAAPPVSLAERRALSRQEAVALMDAMSETYCLDDADFRAVQRENEQHTREWEKKYGYHIRWDGDLMADYVLAYGMMPTFDAPYANPLAVYPDDAKLTIPEAKRIAAQAVSSVEDRLPAEKLDGLTCLWEFDYCRDLGWWWTYDGTWIITWFDGNAIVSRAFLRDADGKPTIVFIYLDDHDPYSDDGVTVYTDF